MEVEKEVVEKFVEETRNVLELVEQALAREDYSGVKRHLQSIIGQAMHVNLRLETVNGDFRVGSYTISATDED